MPDAIPASAPYADPKRVAQMTVGDLVTIAWRRRKLAIGVAVAVAVTVLIAALRTTPLYEAKAELEVLRGRQAVDFASNPDGGRIEFSLLNTHRDRILSSQVLASALQAGGLKDGPAYANASDPVEALRRRLSVTTSRDSWVIDLALRDEDPRRAESGLQAIIDAYLAAGRASASGRASDAVKFLREQVEVARAQLEAAQKDEQAFRQQYNVLSTDADRNHHAGRLTELTQARVALERLVAARSAVLAQVRAAEALPNDQRLGGLLRIESIALNPTVQQQQQGLFALQAEGTQLAQKYGVKHPRMKAHLQALDAKRGQLGEAAALSRATIVSAHEEVTLQATELDQRIAVTEQALAEYRGNLIRLQALSQENATRAKLLDDLRRRLGEEEVVSRLEANQVTVTDRPAAASRPVNIKTTLFAAAALGLGLVAGMGAALGREALDRRVRGAARAAELTGLPLLAHIPAMDELVNLGRQGDLNKLPALAEAYRALRAALRLTSHRGDGARVLVVTSPSPGEGKSTVACRLAVSLASAGHRVLLVDGDLRRPTQHDQLGEVIEKGLSLLLAGEDGIAPKATAYGKLELLGVGEKPPNPAELLHSPALIALIERARRDYDYVIFDTPPLSLVADALSLCDLADGVLLVLRDGHSTRGPLRAALERLEPLRGKLLGFVLNGSLETQGEGYSAYQYAYVPAPRT